LENQDARGNPPSPRLRWTSQLKYVEFLFIMSGYMNPLSLQDLQKKAYKELLDAMIMALEKGEMTAEDSKTSSRKIMRNLDGIESSTELLLFLQDLSNKYPGYKGVFVKFKQEETAYKDNVKLAAVQAKLQKLTGISSP